MRKLEDVEKDIYKVEHVLRTLRLERTLLMNYLQNMETSSKVLAQQVIEKMKK